MDDGNAPTATDSQTLGLPKVYRRACGGAFATRGDLHTPAQTQHCHNYQGSDPIGRVQGGGEAERESELPTLVTSGDEPGGGG